MEKSTTSRQHHLAAFNKNFNTVQHYLKDSFNEKRQEIKESISFFKEEFSGMFDKTNRYFNLATLPVNNFLKDLSQIEKEMEAECNRSNEYCICMDGKMIPASEVFARPMEENY
jgi:hypothetical protein